MMPSELPVIVMTATRLGSAVSPMRAARSSTWPSRSTSTGSRPGEAAAAAGVRSGDAIATLTPTIPDLLGRAPAMQQVFRAIGRLSRSSVNVLITGDSGTGKELAARALHEHSPRPTSRSSPSTLGHSGRAARIGAVRPRERRLHRRRQPRRGRFEQADGGSLFLDEIGDMSTSLQTRLLRVLAEGEFYRVAARPDPGRCARDRSDAPESGGPGAPRPVSRRLFHRLNVIRIELPPLRARRETYRTCSSTTCALRPGAWVEPKTLNEDANDKLCAYAWPGTCVSW